MFSLIGSMARRIGKRGDTNSIENDYRGIKYRLLLIMGFQLDEACRRQIRRLPRDLWSRSKHSSRAVLFLILIESALAGSWMGRVLSDQGIVLFRYRQCFFRTGNVFLSRNGQFVFSAVFFPEKPSGDGAGQNFAHQGRNGVSDLSLNFDPWAGDFKFRREGLESGQFLPGKLSVFPMERADGRPRLGLNSPAWLRFREFQKEAPIPGSPTE